MDKTKKCRECATEIPIDAKKCLHCQADQRRWLARHPVWTVLIVLFGIGAISSAINTTPTSTEQTIKNSNQPETTAPQPQGGQVTKTESVEQVEQNKNQEPINLTGTGQQATNPFQLEKGLRVFKLRHTGQSNFIVQLLDGNGDRVDLLVNEIGAFDGSKAVKINTPGQYLLNIDAGGSWSVEIQ